jgi:hypothetical protein
MTFRLNSHLADNHERSLLIKNLRIKSVRFPKNDVILVLSMSKYGKRNQQKG